MKKVVLLSVLVLVLCAAACLSAHAGDGERRVEYIDGYEVLCSEDFRYAYIVKDGQATIAGYAGGIAAYAEYLHERWIEAGRPANDDTIEYEGEDVDVDDLAYPLVIPSRIDGYPVVAIGDMAFFETLRCGYIIPEGVVSIGDFAFGLCYYFDSIVIPSGVTHIGKRVFDECDGLLTVVIPDSITYIGDAMFGENYGDIGEYSWSGMLIVSKGSYAEKYAQEHGIAIAYEEERMDANGQWKYVLEDDCATITGCVEEPEGDLVIPDELDGYPVMHIGYAAFVMNKGLTSVVIPEGITSIGGRAFIYCESLLSVTIPDNVTSIGDSAFTFCESLESVTLPDSITSIGDFVFTGCTTLAGVTIPDSVTSIGKNAFCACDGLVSLTIPDSVMRIGDGAFTGCEELTLSVAEGSYAEQYAKENGIPYVFTTE